MSGTKNGARLVLCACLALAATSCSRDRSQATEAGPSNPVAAASDTNGMLSETDAVAIATDAYIYGYSLITTEITRVQMSNVAKADNTHAPPNSFANVPQYPPADYRGVSAPNADTLYSVAWVDLRKEPMVFSHPDMGKRFYLFPMYSLWMPVIESPGSRTTGEKAADILISGPGWQGQPPAGMQHVKSPTQHMVILGRTYANGTPADYREVNALQAQYKLVPLSSFGKPYTYQAPPVDPNPGFSMTDKPQEVIDDMDLSTYFGMMARLMGTTAPPAPEDGDILERMARIGLEPGKPFELNKLDPKIQSALKDVGKTAQQKIFAQRELSGTKQNGWFIPAAAGSYGTDYLQRALIAAFGWPANLSQDAIYPYALTDGAGETLTGANNYTLTFAKGNTPPVNGFWSITMYIDDGGWWFNPNPLNKFTVSLRDKPKFNDDGSLTLYFQNQSPGKDKEANWLPAPKDKFILMMRMYGPKEGASSILPPGKGTWQPPPVVKAS